MLNFSAAWKITIIISIPKPGERSKCSRNLSPRSTLLNLHFRIIRKDYRNKPETTEQYAFRPEHSTTSRQVNVADEIGDNVNGKHTATINDDFVTRTKPMSN